MITAIYVRVSTGKQEIENQLDQLTAFCGKQGHEIVYIFKETASGKDDNRPEFEEMFNYARQRRFDLLLFWDLSRFSRSGTLYTLQKLKELDNLGVKWHSYQEPYFSSIGEFKDVVLSIMATLAKIEREKISERTKAGLKKAKNVGKRGKDKKPRNKKGYYK